MTTASGDGRETRPEKGPEAFRTISEASSELGVPQHVLRFWETRFEFVRPVKRAGNRRFYRPQDLQVLRGVRALLHDEGYTIKGVQRLHKEGGLRRLLSAGEGAAAPSAAAPSTSDVQPPRAEVSRVGHDDLEPAQLLVAAATPAEPPQERPSRHVLDPGARERLAGVLRDLEGARAAIDTLLRRA